MLSTEKRLPANADASGDWLTASPAPTSADVLTAAFNGIAQAAILIDAHRVAAPNLPQSILNPPIVYVNTAFTRLTGYSAEEARGRSFDLLQGANTEPEKIAQLRAVSHSVEECVVELLHYRKDGTTFLDRVSMCPILNAMANTQGATRYWAVTLEDVSEQRAVRERLRSSEARLELAMAASELAMWDWNVVSGEVFYNEQWQILLEIPVEDLLLRESLAGRLVLPDNSPHLIADLERHLAGDTSRFEHEFEIPTASGGVKSVVARAQVVRRDSEGRALRVIGVWRDVTARKENLRTLEETHRRWERAVAGTSDGLFDWDLVTGYVWYAPRFSELLGYTQQEFPNSFTAFQRALHESDRVTVLASVRSHLEQRAPLDLSCRLADRAGAYRWFRLRAQAERDAAGRPRRLSGAIRDISMQIDAEQALYRSENFYGTILDALPVSVGYIDRAEQIVYANRASSELLNRSVDQIRGQAMRDVVAPALYGELASHLGAVFRDQTVECQIHVQDAAGESLDIDVTYVPHHDASGDVQGCFLLARNVTARLLLEAELRQSQKMEAIGRLTGGVAHDFNNLLSVVIGNAQLLTRTLRDTPRLYKQADTVLRAALRGAELTKRLLTFARQSSLAPQAVQVSALLNGMGELLKRTLPNDIELRFELDEAIGATKLDAGQFENAVLNLVINARDAMPRGGQMSIATRGAAFTVESSDAPVGLPPGEYVEVCVTDSGSGMTPEVLKRVFEPFFTTKESGKGSGLGLAMVYGFVRQTGGQIAIDSTPDVGTRVRMYFPRTSEAVMVVDGGASNTSELPRGGETVLVLDGNADVRATAVEMLQSLGYRVLAAGTGREVTSIAAREPQLALVFSDVMLPGGISVHNVLQQLRAQLPKIKILLASGFSDSVIAHRSMLDGTQDIIAKPYQLSELARRVRAALDHPEENLRAQA
ncbi:MAG: PAS domain-containing protein [Candidatus Obscuribacterales bacterium]|nr:PAS domain-containing protein [Steroidobacteraceae bacterium]